MARSEKPLDPINKKFFLNAVSGAKIGKNTSSEIAVRCPICGDSSKNKSMTRLHLYSSPNADTDFVNCFNGDCPCHNKTVFSFLRDFFPALLENYKRETFQEKLLSASTSGSSKETGDVLKQFSGLNESQEKQKVDIITQDLSGFMHVLGSSEMGLQYLKGRQIEYKPSKFGSWYVGYQDLKIDNTLYRISDSIVVPLYFENKMYGFYSRNMHKKEFSTYMHESNNGYKIWNWFNVDLNKPVYIFEGIFDAISSGLDNIIALMGAKLPEDRLEDMKEPVFVLDNDRTGLENSLKYAKRGYKVYVQPEIYTEKDMNSLKTSQNLSETTISDIIQTNLFSGISAEVRIKARL